METQWRVFVYSINTPVHSYTIVVNYRYTSIHLFIVMFATEQEDTQGVRCAECNVTTKVV